jgi:hypothetical protein
MGVDQRKTDELPVRDMPAKLHTVVQRSPEQEPGAAYDSFVYEYRLWPRWFLVKKPSLRKFAKAKAELVKALIYDQGLQIHKKLRVMSANPNRQRRIHIRNMAIW